jgi:hypothetical protein
MIMSVMPMETPPAHGPLEAEVLETIERLDRGLMTRRLVGAEDDIRDLLLAAGFVEEAHFRRPRSG